MQPLLSLRKVIKNLSLVIGPEANILPTSSNELTCCANAKISLSG